MKLFTSPTKPKHALMMPTSWIAPFGTLPPLLTLDRGLGHAALKLGVKLMEV